jgi:uncharacterized repeat protein (TIGR01451 family)
VLFRSVELTKTGVGIAPFDPLLTTSEDVTVLASGTGIAKGRVYQDNNGNGSFDAAVDTPLGGVAVTIVDSTGTAYVVYTDAAGHFTQVVAVGSTVVDVDDATLPAGLVLTTGADRYDPTTVTVPSGGSANRDTGYVPASGPTGIVSGNVWNDADRSGSKDASEIDMLGVQVQLRDAGNNLVATAYTDLFGDFSFPTVPVGTYKLHLVPPSGYSLTTANNDLSVTTGGGAKFFGLAENPPSPTYSISGQVFEDADGDGLKVVGESGTNAGGLYAVLVNGSNLVVASTAVAADGSWSVSGIGDGSYSLVLATSGGTVGNSAPAARLPIGWFNTGESLTGAGTDGTADGILAVTVSGAALSGITQGIRQQADVLLHKNGPALVGAAGTAGYTLRLYNAGPGSADGTLVTDALPSGAANMNWTCGNAVGGAVCPTPSGSGAISETIAILPAGGSLTYTVTDRKSTRLNSSHNPASRMPSSA